MKTRELHGHVQIAAVKAFEEGNFNDLPFFRELPNKRLSPFVKAKIIFEAPENKIELTESEFDKAIGEIGQGEWGKKELAERLKKILFPVFMFLLFLPAHAANIATVSKFVNHTAAEKIKNEKAIQKIRETASGECFKNEWLKRKLIQTNSKSNIQVLETLLAADVSIELEMYNKRFSSVNGYTYESTKRIWLNRKYHNNYGPCSVANNLFHEISHKIGFSHDYKPNKERPYSVPYSINAVMEICCKD